MRRRWAFVLLMTVLGVTAAWAGARVLILSKEAPRPVAEKTAKRSRDFEVVKVAQVGAPPAAMTAAVKPPPGLETIPREVPPVGPAAVPTGVMPEPPAPVVPEPLPAEAPPKPAAAVTEALPQGPAAPAEPAPQPEGALPWAEPVVITANRAWQPMEHLPQNMTVVTARDIKRFPAMDLLDVLTQVPGVNVTSRTRFGHFAPLSIHGSSSRHVLVMVDGIPFNTQASGQADILSALPTMNVRQIEIVKGSPANSWGSSLGGVIHVVTQDPAPDRVPRFSYEQAFGEFGTLREGAELSGTAGRLGYYISGENFEADGARNSATRLAKEGVTHKKYFGKLNYDLAEELKATGSFGYSGSDVEEGVFQSGLRMEMPYFARYGRLALDYDPGEREHVETAFKFNRQSIRTDNFLDTVPLFLSTVAAKDAYYGADVKSVTTLRERDTLVVGYEAVTQSLKSSQMDKVRDVLIQAPYVNYTFSQGPADLLAGVRYDSNEEFGDEVNPGAGVVFRIPGLRDTFLRTHASHAFHAPPLLWKYFEDAAPGITANNPDIEPERAWVYETGLETRAIPRTRLKLGLYRSDVSQAIVTAVNAQGRFFKDNVEKVRQEGVELESHIALWEPLELVAAGGFNDVENRATGDNVRGRGVPRQSFRLGLDYLDLSGWGAFIGGRYDRWDSPVAALANDRKFIFDARFSKAFQDVLRNMDFTAFLNIYNLTNSKYWSSINYPLPERTFEGGFSLEY